MRSTYIFANQVMNHTRLLCWVLMATVMFSNHSFSRNRSLLAEGEASHLPDDILLSKTENGSMEKLLFVDWLKHSVIPHKQEVNPDGKSLLILDNHGSRFSCEAIENVSKTT